MNENIAENVSFGNSTDTDIDNIVDTSVSGIDSQAYYDYDYRSYLQTIINNQNTVITNLQKSNDIANDGFTTLLFCLISAFCYILVKNYIRK